MTEAFLGLAPCLLGPLALGGHDAAPGPVQGFAQAADDRADQHEEAQGDRVVYGSDLKGVKRVDEEVGRGQGAENGGQEPGPEAAEVRGDDDGREEGHVQDPVPQHRPEVQTDQQQYQRQRDRRGQQGKAVGNQSGASCFVHANLVGQRGPHTADGAARSGFLAARPHPNRPRCASHACESRAKQIE